MTIRTLATLLLLLLAAPGRALNWQKPPQAVLDALHAPLPPNVFVAPTHDLAVLATLVRYPPIADLAQPLWKLAGTRVAPRSGGFYGTPYFAAFEIVSLGDGTTRHVEFPAPGKLSSPVWNADGQRFLVALTLPDHVELWVWSRQSGKARKLPVRLNPLLGDDAQWLPDQRTILVKLAQPHKLAAAEDDVPTGPSVQETHGGKASSTYEVRDVLKNPRDEARFDAYMQSRLALVDADKPQPRPIGPAGILTRVQASPDGQHILVETIHRPYSYQTTSERFPREVEVWDLQGKIEHKLASQPLAESVPMGGVRTGPRDFRWRQSAPATLIWVEALDGGDYKNDVPEHDQLWMLPAPFGQPPVELARTTQRLVTLRYGAHGLTLLTEEDPILHRTRTLQLNAEDPKVPPRVLWDLSSDERYQHPGYPVVQETPRGEWLLLQIDDTLYLQGAGASPDGDRPFLDALDLKMQQTTRLFRSAPDAYEQFVAVLDPRAGTLLTRRESPQDPPNLWLRTLGAAQAAVKPGESERALTGKQLTHLTDPTPQVRGITKQLVKYKRADGVELSFTLYLPPNYQPGTKLPAVLWAYPLDYADAKVAGQVSGSPQRFTVLSWPLQLFCLLDGYAVIDNPTMPVIGESTKIYDTYLPQLVSSAEAAVNKAVEMGVVDRERIGVTGHSHGGLMTANLLAHTNLFRAGVARSGAYNRSLTAFGFQNERRTLWEAPEVYTSVSPLFHVPKIDEPLLIIHGEADYNPGTIPLQSEKLFEAIRGNGGTARLVMLPLESHAYLAMESNEHVLYEMLAWFDKYVKKAVPRKG